MTGWEIVTRAAFDATRITHQVVRKQRWSDGISYADWCGRYWGFRSHRGAYFLRTGP